jgi:HEAT repeat protein
VLRALVTVALLGFLAPTPHAHAQSLDATDPAELGAAIAAAGHEGDRALALQLGARIERGLPSALLARAIDALVSNGTPPALSALTELALHRRAAVRAQVARSLAFAHDPSARRVLADLLDDPEATVRSAAAVSLGDVGAQGVMDTVMLAAVRGVVEAAILFGQQAAAPDAARLLRRADTATLEAIAPALRILLQRANVSRGTKLAIVRRLDELGGVLAESLLREVSAALPETDPVRRAIDTALAADPAAEVAE